MEQPPSSLAYRTTGSTLLHPVSDLLGIPLDQVTAGIQGSTLQNCPIYGHCRVLREERGEEEEFSSSGWG